MNLKATMELPALVVMLLSFLAMIGCGAISRMAMPKCLACEKKRKEYLP